MRGIALTGLALLWVMNVWGHMHGQIAPLLAYSITAILSIVAIVIWRRVKL